MAKNKEFAATEKVADKEEAGSGPQLAKVGAFSRAFDPINRLVVRLSEHRAAAREEARKKAEEKNLRESLSHLSGKGTKDDLPKMRALIESLGGKTIVDADGSTALMAAAAFLNTATFEALLPVSDPLAVNKNGWDALMSAVAPLDFDRGDAWQSLREEIVFELIKRSNLAQKNEDGDTALLMAARQGWREGVRAIASASNVDERNTLDRDGNNAVQLLFQAEREATRHAPGKNARRTRAQGGKDVADLIDLMTQFNVATANKEGDTLLLQILNDDYEDEDTIEEVARASGCETRDSQGNTPLEIVSMQGGRRFAEALLRCGASAKTIDDQGNSPLWHAATWGRTDMLELLLPLSNLPSPQKSPFDAAMIFNLQWDEAVSEDEESKKATIQEAVRNGMKIDRQTLSGLFPHSISPDLLRMLYARVVDNGNWAVAELIAPRIDKATADHAFLMGDEGHGAASDCMPLWRAQSRAIDERKQLLGTLAATARTIKDDASAGASGKMTPPQKRTKRV